MNHPELRRSERLANRRKAVRNKNLQVPNRMHRRRAMKRAFVSEEQLNQSTACVRQQTRSLGGQELRDGIRHVREFHARIAEQQQQDGWPAEQRQRDEAMYVRQNSASTAQQEDRSTSGEQQRDEIAYIGEHTDSRNEQSDEVTIIGQQNAEQRNEVTVIGQQNAEQRNEVTVIGQQNAEQRNEVTVIGQQNAEDSDVIYMYTVDRQNGRMVELINLAEENQQNTAGNVRITGQATESAGITGQATESAGITGQATELSMITGQATELSLITGQATESAGITGQATESSRITGQATDPDPSQSVVIIGETLKKNDAHRPKTSAKTKPQKSSAQTKLQKMRQRHSPDIRCPSCRRNYDSIQKRGQGLHSSRCGHLLCLSCFNKLPEPRRCVVCRMKIVDFCRIFL